MLKAFEHGAEDTLTGIAATQVLTGTHQIKSTMWPSAVLLAVWAGAAMIQSGSAIDGAGCAVHFNGSKQ